MGNGGKDKKRKWWQVVNDILGISESEEVPEKLWQELLSASKWFMHLRDSCWLAESRKNEKWKDRFIREMLKTATVPWQWKVITHYAEKGSPVWEKAIENLYRGIKKAGNNLYQWQGLKKVLPAGHSLLPEIRANIRQIKKEKREKKRRGLM